MRIVGWIIWFSSFLALAGCASAPNSGYTTASDPPPTTGSLLPQRHRFGAVPVDVYDAERLRAQGITSASEALRDIPQNYGR